MKVYTQLVAQPPVLNSEQQIEQVHLPFDDRKRGRLKIKTRTGQEAGIQIERGQVLRDGSWLSTDKGDLLEVKALPEEVTTAYVTDSTLFAQGCYHLGNRHVPLQIGEGFLRYQRDYVLDEMLKGLGITPQHEKAVFEPENGAYAPGSGHHHGHDHEHHKSHDHTHAHYH